jgi:hypothetical protein
VFAALGARGRRVPGGRQLDSKGDAVMRARQGARALLVFALGLGSEIRAKAQTSPETIPGVATNPTTAPNVAAANPGGDAPLELSEDQAGATDQLLNGDALKIYGFGDVGFREMLMPKNSPWLLYLNRHPSFFVGHLNLYFDSQLSERWRALAEVRFTYLPQGNWQRDANGVYTHQSTSTGDYTNYDRDRSLGSIMLERAYIEYAAFPFLSFQAGQFLTPYGIWNVDHGTPVIIGVTPPFIVGAKLLPDTQIGLLAQGSAGIAKDLELGYAAAISNGRADIVAYQDLDSNKALTGRLSLTYRGLGELTLGTTAYAGRTTDETQSLYFVGADPKSQENVTYQLDERSYALDLRWTYKELRVQAEGIVNDRKFTARGRPPSNGGLEPDRRNAGGYALVGYRTPLFGTMPYVKAEYSPDPALQSIGVDKRVVLLTAGLNVRPVPRVVLKAEYSNGFFPGAAPHTFGANDVASLDFQIAWAF